MIEPLLSDDVFLADVESAPADPSQLHLWWLGQSGYLLKHDSRRVLIDPYLSDSLTRKYATTEKPHVRMTRRVIDPARLGRITLITSSHQHTDHLDAETLQAIRKADEAQREPSSPLFVAARANAAISEERWGQTPDTLLDEGDTAAWGDLRIYAIASAHDQLERTERGWHKFLGYVFEIGPFTLYHSGDTVVYPGLVDRLSRFSIDLAILPINGKVGNMNGAAAAKLAKAIGAKQVVPCHYDMFEFNTADPAEQFIPECERLGQPYRVLQAGERMTLSAKQTSQA